MKRFIKQKAHELNRVYFDGRNGFTTLSEVEAQMDLLVEIGGVAGMSICAQGDADNNYQIFISGKVA